MTDSVTAICKKMTGWMQKIKQDYKNIGKCVASPYVPVLYQYMGINPLNAMERGGKDAVPVPRMQCKVKLRDVLSEMSR